MNILHLPCIEIDEVQEVVPVTTFRNMPRLRTSHDWTSVAKTAVWAEDCHKLFKRATLAKQQHHLSQQEGTSDNIPPNSLWLVLVAGLSGTARPIETHHEASFARYAAFLDKVAKNPYRYSAVLDIDGIIPEVEASIYLWSSKRLFGITEMGRAVLVPRGTRKGDKIILPAFSVVPIVVRQSGGTRYEGKVLGEAFVPDVMSGDYVEKFKKTHKRMEDAFNYAVWRIS